MVWALCGTVSVCTHLPPPLNRLPTPHPTTPLQEEPLRSKALTFSSVAGARGVQEKSVETDVVVAEVAPQVLASLQALLSDLFIPLLATQQPARRQAESAKDEFIQVGGRGAAGAQCCHQKCRLLAELR